MGTGCLRGCMISHSTDANPTIRHQPLHCHNAPLSCTSTTYLKINPALDINLCFAVFHILCVDVKTLHSIFCTTIPYLACSQDTSASKSKPLHSRHIRYKEGVPSITALYISAAVYNTIWSQKIPLFFVGFCLQCVLLGNKMCVSRSAALKPSALYISAAVYNIIQFGPKRFSIFFYTCVLLAKKCVCYILQRCNLPPYTFPQLSNGPRPLARCHAAPNLILHCHTFSALLHCHTFRALSQ